MKNEFNKNSTDKQRLIGAITGVEKQLASLAPHPDQPGATGPVFVKADSRCPSGGEREATLGSLFLDCVTGGALSLAVADIIGIPDSIEWGQAAEAADEYWMDRRGAVSRNFNVCAPVSYDRREQAWQNDLPERMKLEGAYAALSRKMDNMPQLRM